MVSVWDININSWISKVKKYEETITNKQSQNGRGEYQIDETTYAKGVTLNAYICVQERAGLKNWS